MALWTPADLATPPRLWLRHRNATWSGSNLTAVPNNGADGGTPTPTTVTKGTAVGGFDSLGFASGGSRIAVPLSAFNSGNMSTFFIRRITTNTGDRGLLRGADGWAASGTVAVYGYTGTWGPVASGNGWNAFLSSNSPSHFGMANSPAATWIMQLDIVGSSDLVRHNGATIAGGTRRTGTVASESAGSWIVGNVNTTSENLGGGIAEGMFFDYILSQSDYEKLEGWGSWETFGDGSGLDAGHPYKSAAPTTGTHYTLTASTAAYTFTAQAATLKATRKVAASAGAFIYTAQSASLEYGREVAAAAASFTLTAQDATFDRTYVLGASSATFTATGQAAGLLAARKITAAASAFTATGQDATFARTWEIAADAGDVTLTGQAASLEIGYRLASDAGAVTITGQDATLTYDANPAAYVLEADAATVSIAAASASLEAGRAFGASAAVYVLSGQTAALKRGFVISGSGAAYLVTAAPATFSHVEIPWPAVAPGEPDWTAQSPDAASWTAQTPASASWSAQAPASDGWSPATPSDDEWEAA